MSGHGRGPMERALARWAGFAGRRPWLSLALILGSAAAAGGWGAGIQIRSNMEDLFPEDTPAVVAAREARAVMPSSNQMVVVFGSPDQEANRAAATAFCEQAGKLDAVASMQCRRDIDFFRRNATLFLDIDELRDIERDVDAAIRRATEDQFLDNALTEGLDDKPAAQPGDDEGFSDEDFGDAPAVGGAGSNDAGFSDEDFGDAPAKAVPAPGPSPQQPPQPGAADPAAKPERGRLALPTEEEIRERFGAGADLREWSESPDGTVLGVKLFPTIPASDLEAARAFTLEVRGILEGMDLASFHPEMEYAVRGDYAEASAEVDRIRGGLAKTTLLALGGIALIQLLAFRRLRALLLLFVPLIVGVAWTVGFARGAIGYLNLITAFIFGILFGLGNDFGVYTLSRYTEERASGGPGGTPLSPAEAVVVAVPGLWSALRTAALTTMAAFASLALFDFRGFSQFGVIAAGGVLFALVATMVTFPALAVALDRLRPEPSVKVQQAQGLRIFGLLARPGVARAALAVLVCLAVAGGWYAQGLRFENNFRKLRTPRASKQEDAAAEQRLGNRYGKQAEKKLVSPILIVTDSIDEARLVHDQLVDRQESLTRLSHFVSIHSFVPTGQAEKAAIGQRIRKRIIEKIDLMGAEDKAEAERGLELLDPRVYEPDALPDFVRKRFLDTDGNLGRYLLLYATGNLADARSVQEVTAQMGRWTIPVDPTRPDGPTKTIQATASYFILGEADAIVRHEGPWAVLAAAIAVLLVIGVHYRSLRLVAFSFLPLVFGFGIFLGAARGLDLQLNLFSISVLPSIFGIGIDGTVHIVHRSVEVGERPKLALVLQQIGGAAWIAAITTVVGFGALLFQDNPGVSSIGSMAVAGILIVCTLANVMAGAAMALWGGLKSAAGRED